MVDSLVRGDNPRIQQFFNERVIFGDLPKHPPVEEIGPAVADIQDIAAAVAAHDSRNHGGAHTGQVVAELGIGKGNAVCLLAGLTHNARIVARSVRIIRQMVVHIVYESLARKLTGQTARICTAHAVAERKNDAGRFLTVFNQKAVLVFRSCFSRVCQAETVHVRSSYMVI